MVGLYALQLPDACEAAGVLLEIEWPQAKRHPSGSGSRLVRVKMGLMLWQYH